MTQTSSVEAKPPKFQKTAAQAAATKLLGSAPTHTLLYGGSRSGKTFIKVRSIVIRALKNKSRHAIWRLRFNHIKSSIFADTLPKVMKVCFPDLHYQANKTDLVVTFHNDSEIWLGGLDNAERVEKVLGQEFSTVYFNECSQIPYDSVTTALSRLAEKSGLVNRAYYDCNPPSKMHWTHKLFIEGVDPETGVKLPEGVYSHMRMNPADNIANLSEDYLRMLERLPPRKRKRFLDGEFTDDRDDALWRYEIIRRMEQAPILKRIVVAIDPATSNSPGSDETGIIAAGIDEVHPNPNGYVLADATLKGKPEQWGRTAVRLAERLNADCIIGEGNNGGDMIESVVRASGWRGRYKKVTATRGKALRAEPISTHYEHGRVYHVGEFEDLEEQMCDFTVDFDRDAAGYSPDRLDALVWALTELMPPRRGYDADVWAS